MTTRPNYDANADYTHRRSHLVETPDRFTSWREYAFSSAPELGDLAEGEPQDAAPAEDTSSV